MNRKHSTTFLLLLPTLAGCNSVPANAPPFAPVPPNGTNIPAGTYAGEIEWTGRQGFRDSNGNEVMSDPVMSAAIDMYSFDEVGVLLDDMGQRIEVGRELFDVQDFASFRKIVRSIDYSSNRAVLESDLRASDLGGDIGTTTEVITFIPPDFIEVQSNIEVAFPFVADGLLFVVEAEGTGVLPLLR